MGQSDTSLSAAAAAARDLCARFDADGLQLQIRSDGRDYSIAAWRGGSVSAVDMATGEGARLYGDDEPTARGQTEP